MMSVSLTVSMSLWEETARNRHLCQTTIGKGTATIEARRCRELGRNKGIERALTTTTVYSPNWYKLSTIKHFGHTADQYDQYEDYHPGPKRRIATTTMDCNFCHSQRNL